MSQSEVKESQTSKSSTFNKPIDTNQTNLQHLIRHLIPNQTILVKGLKLIKLLGFPEMVLIILSALNYLASHCPQHTLTLEHERLKSTEENINKIVHPLTPSESCEEIKDVQVNVIRSLFSFPTWVEIKKYGVVCCL